MKAGDLVKHQTAISLGVGLITGLKEGSSGVFVRWLNTGTLQLLGCGRGTQEVDIMLEVVSEER